MSIGYSITLGYNPNNIPTDNTLIKLVNSITKQELEKEYLQYEKPDLENKYKECLNAYFPSTDLTLKINKDEIYQCASGGGIEREIKEGLRRAFCRLMLKKAHKEKIEINIMVS
jgi:hypothetical protein